MMTVHGPSWSGSVNDAPCSVKSRPSNTLCSPPAMTLGGRLGGGGVGQLIENDALAVCPTVTVTDWDGPPLTVQLLAKIGRATGRLTVEMSVVVAPLYRTMCWF